YTGAPLTVKNGTSLPPLVIPVEPISKAVPSWFYQVRKAVLLSPSTSFPLWILAVCLCLAFPTPVNISATVAYTGLLTRKKLKRAVKKRSDIAVFDADKKPLANVVVALQKKHSSRIVTLTQTSAAGAVFTW